MEYGCIGKKLSHSFSKIIHNELADYEYELIEIDENELEDFFEKADFKAINVTIPYKKDVIKYLDFVDSAAEEIGAVNTISNRGNRLYGYNTDFGGLKMLIEKQGLTFKNKKVLVMTGLLKDKDYFYIAKKLKEITEFAVIFTPENPRALDKNDYAQILNEQGVETVTQDTIKDAYNYAVSLAKEKNMPLVILGSLYTYAYI